jgi:hypothetical protein
MFLHKPTAVVHKLFMPHASAILIMGHISWIMALEDFRCEPMSPSREPILMHAGLRVSNLGRACVAHTAAAAAAVCWLMHLHHVISGS